MNGLIAFVLSFALLSSPPPYDEGRALVARVVDGDTVSVLVSGFYRRTVRYIGIDAPESTRRRDCFGGEATEAHRRLVSGQALRLERDVSDVDRYGRLLRYAYLPDGRMVNELLVREGYAQARPYPPDVKHQARLGRAEGEARAARVGLWGPCARTPTPTPPLSSGPGLPVAPGGGCPAGCIAPTPGCAIKGNVNAQGERIYHVPGGAYYERTGVRPQEGDRWFCTPGEAEANGFRAPRR